MELNGVNLKMLGDGYRSRKTADELLEAVGAAIDSTVRDKIKESDFVAVMCDETTDIAIQGKLIVFIRLKSTTLEPVTYTVGEF